MATPQDVNDRLTNAMYGSPQTLPDQRRRFLGSLRERTVLAIRVKDLQNSRTFDLFSRHLDDFTDRSALVNGKIDHQLMGPYLKLLAQKGFPFTLVNKPETPDDSDSYALLIVSREAVDQETINILELYPLAQSKPTETSDKKPEKKGWFSKLFH
jgi:uncharacterized protein YueI